MISSRIIPQKTHWYWLIWDIQYDNAILTVCDSANPDFPIPSTHAGAERYYVSSAIHSIIWLPSTSSFTPCPYLANELLQALALYVDFSGL